MSRHIPKLMLSLAVSASAVFVSCSGKDSTTTAAVKSGGTFDPKPADPNSLEGQLKRFKGQTSFLTPYQTWGRGPMYGAARSEEAPSVKSSARAIQESDIFKIGQAGSKLLYLLNNYRGLQVVSFADGPDHPKLLGRVEATGNWAHDMYFDAAHQRLIVLENVWFDDESDTYDYSDTQSRLLVYDVSQATAPRLAQTLSIKGQLSESRMVGEVLYVATSVRPSYTDRQSDKKSAGYIQSFDLSQGSSIRQVEQMRLSAPVSWGEDMNVVEVKEGDAFKYYVIAILSQDSWLFWDRQSVVEVVDISDAKGKIKPMMVATAKGRVSKRSQTTLSDNTLIVTSNYTPANSNNMRVSVETFTLPTGKAEVISRDEAEFRRLSMERAINKKQAELTARGLSADELSQALDAYRNELMADKELGLRGRFVKEDTSTTTDTAATAEAKTSTLRKLYSDSNVSVGSTQNLSAALQDVRYQNGLLYAFWVPANNIDPLDIFDISKPQEGVKHLSHLEFDGWIQHAIPVSYAGKNYIMGLGWIIPSVNNERNRRYPQAALFQIKRSASGKVKAELLAQQNLQGSSTWANFNAQDKMIETRFADAAKGTIMYTFSSWEQNKYTNGGKLVAFDLSKAEDDPEKVFAEGGVLKGDEGWLRRMFSNPEIERVNGFADTALSTYNVPANFASGASAIVEAANILELARNMVGFEIMGDKGVQLVSDQSWWTQSGSSQLRLVKLGDADAELGQVLGTIKVDGSIVDYAKIADNSLLILSQRYQNLPDTGSDGRNTGYKYFYTATRVVLDGEQLKADGEEKWEYRSGETSSNTPRFGYLQKIIRLKDGTWLVAAGGSIKQLAPAGQAFTTKELSLTGCTLTDADIGQLQNIGGHLYLSYNQVIEDPQRKDLRYQRNWIGQVAVADSKATCGQAINIPGRLLHVMGDNHIVTEDTRLIDITQHGEGDRLYYQTITEQSLDSLAVAPQDNKLLASLRDLYDPKNVATDAMKPLNERELVFVESNVLPYRGRWGIASDIWRPMPGNRTQNMLSVIGFDGDYAFTKSSYALELKGQSHARVVEVLDGQNKDDRLIVLSQGRHMSVLGYNGSQRPQARKLQKRDANGQWSSAKDYVSLTGSYWYWSNELGGIKHHLVSREIFVPQGLSGLTTVKIVD